MAQRALAMCLVTFIIYSVCVDYAANGFGVNNMRVVSFVDSLWHCYCFRVRAVSYFTPKELSSPDKPPRLRRANSMFVYTSKRKDVVTAIGLLVRALLIKYVGGTVVSLMLGTDPVWLKSPRHILSFLGAVTIVQGLPAFVVGRRLNRLSFGASRYLVETIRGSAYLRAAIRFSGSLYKMRKMGFITVACITSNYSWGLLVALAVWTVECSSVMMSTDAKIEGHHPKWLALKKSLWSSRWRVSACASLCLVAECVVFQPDNFLLHDGNTTWWRWASPFKIAAFGLLVVRNFGGFKFVTGYPLLSGVGRLIADWVRSVSSLVAPGEAASPRKIRLNPVRLNTEPVKSAIVADSDSDGNDAAAGGEEEHDQFAPGGTTDSGGTENEEKGETTPTLRRRRTRRAGTTPGYHTPNRNRGATKL